MENLTGNITVDGPLRVNNQVGGYALAGSSANFEFKAGTDTKNGTATFNDDISLGRFVNLKVDAHTANFKGIDTGNGGFNTLDFSGVTDKVNINKLITASTNVAVKNFNINELIVKTNGISVGEYTHFSEDIGSQSRINTVRLETGTRSIFSGGVKFKGGEKLVIDEFYYSPWNYFDARNIKNVEITRKFTSSTPENPWGTSKLMFNNLTLGYNASLDYSKFSNLTIQGDFINNQGTINYLVRDGQVATLNVGNAAAMMFSNDIDSATGFYKPLIKINSAQDLVKNTEHVLLKAKIIGYGNVSTGTNGISNVNLEEQFKERLALYNNNNRMDTCVVRNTDDIKACGMAIGDQSMVNNPDNYKYLIGKAWKNIGISKTANGSKISVYYLGNSTPTENGGNTTNLPTSTTNNARSANYALVKNAPFARYSATPNLVAINQHDFGTIESVFELADRSKDIDTLYTHSGAQGRDLLQTLLIDSHDAGYARTMIDATSANEITKQLNAATTTLNNIASLEHKTSGLQTLSLSNAMILNSRLVNLSRRHTNNIDSFAQRLQALKDQRFASLESAAEVLYQFAPKYEKPTNVWANAIGGTSYYYGDTSYFYMNAGVLQEFAHFGSNDVASLNTFKVNATRNPLNTHARVMMGGELKLAKEVFLNLGFVYLHNLISNIGHFASNLGMRYSF